MTWKGTRFWSLAGGDWCNLVRLEAVRFCHREDRLRVDNSGVVNFFFFFFTAFLKSESREYFFNMEKYFKIP